MPRRMKALLDEERGTVMTLTALALPLLIMLLGAVTELGQALAVRSELQTAADAASLAGAQQGERWMAVSIRRDCTATHKYWVEGWYHCTKTDEKTGGCVEGHWHSGYWAYRSYSISDPSPPRLDRVRKAEILDREGWRNHTWAGTHNGDPASCTPRDVTVDRQWSEFPPDTRDTSQAYGWLNAARLPPGVNPTFGVAVADDATNPGCGADPNCAPNAVTVVAEATVPTHFLRLAGIDGIPVRVVGRAYTRAAN